jgi:glycosyltransferase involved in cell wall biosynthesis
MRIVLDLQGAQSESRFRGIGRYTLSLAEAIIRHRRDHEVIVALSDLYPDTVEPIRGLFDGLLAQKNIRVWQAPGPVGASSSGNDWRRAAARRIREAFLASLEPDLVHVSNLLPGEGQDVVASVGIFTESFLSVVTVHDLIPLANADAYLKPYPRFERFYIESLTHLQRADGWLAVSEWSAQEAIDSLKLDAEFVINASEGCDAIFRKVPVSKFNEERIRGQYRLPGPFVMYSGGSDSRKNLNRLIRAYAQLPDGVRRQHHLLFVGSIPPESVTDLRATARTAGLGPDELRFTGYVKDADLLLLYNLCQLFVLPSIHEGFGLPALEAMTCGAPVIGANVTSLPEVIGWPDAMFDPFDTVSMSSKMSQCLTDNAFRSELVRRGLEQAKRFSWDESGKRAIGAFEMIQSRRSPKRGSISSGTTVQRLSAEIRTLQGSPDDQDLLRTARAIAWNHPEASGQRLLVDVSVLVQVDAGSGIQRVVRSLLTALPNHLTTRQMLPVYAITGRRGYRHAKYVGGISPVTATDHVLEPRPGDIFLGLDLSPDAVVAQADYFDELRRLGVTVLFVVYDLLPTLMPHRFPLDAQRRHVRWLDVVSSTDGALCISRSVADELRSWIESNGGIRYRPFRIAWFHLAADARGTGPVDDLPAGAREILQTLAARPTFVVVGTLEPRKGHSQTLNAFEHLWDGHMDVNLVFVGKEGWHVGPLIRRLRHHPEFGSRLFWLDHIPDQYLDEVYRASACLILASEGEGFGLPVIEAARIGTPILARDIPVLREVAGDSAYYFRGSATGDLIEALRDWLKLWSEGRHPRSDGIVPLTWDQSAEQIVEILVGNRRYVRLSPTSSPN